MVVEVGLAVSVCDGDGERETEKVLLGDPVTVRRWDRVSEAVFVRVVDIFCDAVPEFVRVSDRVRLVL